MIAMESVSGNIVRVNVPETLRAGDFNGIAPQIDDLLRQHASLRLLVDAAKFSGWENMTAFEQHMRFVKEHQRRVERIAVLAGHVWQHWLAGVFRLFVHPDVRVFKANESEQALDWLKT